MTLSEENYLKAIYHLFTETEKEVSTNAIADYMNTKASSVTDMLKKLAEKELINYRKYQGVSLTLQGKQKAIQIIRKHRLWEVFLVEKLDFKWEEVHEIAEELEHIESEKLIDRLEEFLGFPKNDPHGDPIPNKEGVFEQKTHILLSDLHENETGICIAVKNTSKDFLSYLSKVSIGLGSEIKVKSIESFDNSMVLLIDNQSFTLSYLVCKNIFVEKK